MRGPSTTHAGTLPAEQDWTRAACKDMDPDLWFRPDGHDTWMPETVADEHGRPVERIQRERTRHDWSDQPGKEVCARCPIIVECFDFSQRNRIVYGTWGGFNEHERASMRGDRMVQPCGTAAAWRRHKQAKEEPCGPCVEAYNGAKRARRRVKGRAA